MSQADPTKRAPVESHRLEVVECYGRLPTQKHALVARKLQSLYAPSPTLPEPFRDLLHQLDQVSPARGDPT